VRAGGRIASVDRARPPSSAAGVVLPVLEEPGSPREVLLPLVRLRQVSVHERNDDRHEVPQRLDDKAALVVVVRLPSRRAVQATDLHERTEGSAGLTVGRCEPDREAKAAISAVHAEAAFSRDEPAEERGQPVSIPWQGSSGSGRVRVHGPADRNPARNTLRDLPRCESDALVRTPRIDRANARTACASLRAARTRQRRGWSRAVVQGASPPHSEPAGANGCFSACCA